MLLGPSSTALGNLVEVSVSGEEYRFPSSLITSWHKHKELAAFYKIFRAKMVKDEVKGIKNSISRNQLC